jgi:N-acetyl-gamma-glutamyl-phosphate reductase
VTQTVAVLGVDTPVGGELVRLLDAHPGLELSFIGSVSRAGSPLGELHPQLGDGGRLLLPADVNLMPPVDAAFLCLGPGQVEKAGEGLLERGVKVIAAGPDEGRWPDGWAYGLPELAEIEIGIADRLVVPSAVGAAAALALVPTLNEGMIEPDPLMVAVAGPGAGNPAFASELEAALLLFTGAEVGVSVAAEAGPGRLTAATVRTPAPAADLADLIETTSSAYAESPTVSVAAPAGDWMLGSVRVSIAMDMDERTATATYRVRADTLARRAGMAVWAANLMLGREELQGVPLAGLGSPL